MLFVNFFQEFIECLLRGVKIKEYINLCLDGPDLILEFRLVCLVDIDDFLSIGFLDGVTDWRGVVIRSEFMFGELDDFRVGAVMDVVGTFVDSELDVAEGHLDALDEEFLLDLHSSRQCRRSLDEGVDEGADVVDEHDVT